MSIQKSYILQHVTFIQSRLADWNEALQLQNKTLRQKLLRIRTQNQIFNTPKVS